MAESAADEIAGSIASVDLGQDLDITSDDYFLDEVDMHIQENLEDELVQEALKKGVDLRQYSKQIEEELQEVENASIQDYMKESQNIASLHNQIQACDSILETMEEMLHGFQSDLGSISSEIQSLQEQSISMNVKLKNRQAVRGELSQFVDEMVVPEYLINTILDLPVTERQFLEQLHELNHKISFVKQQSYNDAKSYLDVKDVLEKLKLKAMAKIREFLLQKIYSFRKPLSNYQMPQNTMLKFRFFYEFLLANERVIAKEIKDVYVDTMSKIYYTYFRRYTDKLFKLQFEEQADKDDLMGAEDMAKKGFFSTKSTMKNRSTIFTVGNRANVLTSDLEASVIVPHTIQTKFAFETLFRSQQYALLDNSCREYLFVTDFFLVTGAAAQDTFNVIMGRTLTLLLKHLEACMLDCFDSIAIFLCIHIVFRYQVIMHKRAVPALDRYYDHLLGMLWPRFVQIFESNMQSIKDTDPSRLGSIDTRPHYVTRRYAEFSGAVVSVNESFPSERVAQLLAGLQSDVQDFVLRMAAEFPERRQQLIFLINNYDMMLNVIMERTTDDSKESESFKELLNSTTAEFVDEILSPHIGALITFVKQAEAMLEKGQGDALKREDKRVTGIVRVFNACWKKTIEELNHEVLMSFTNFKNGTQILQGALTQMISYYHRFQKVLNSEALKQLPIRNELINVHAIMVEVKKHKPTF